MADYVCRECGEPISGYARKCPHCGDPFPMGNDRDRLLKVFLGSGIGLAVLWALYRIAMEILKTG